MDPSASPRACGDAADRPGGGTAGSAAKVTIVLPAAQRSVLDFEAFVNRLDFVSRAEKDRMLIAGGEVLDNLITHGEVGPQGICTRVRRRGGLVTLAFFVESHPIFAEFTARLASRCVGGPRFDFYERRWHGLGLAMCQNLADGVRYRSGLRHDRVFLEFRP